MDNFHPNFPGLKQVLPHRNLDIAGLPGARAASPKSASCRQLIHSSAENTQRVRLEKYKVLPIPPFIFSALSPSSFHLSLLVLLTFASCICINVLRFASLTLVTDHH